MYCSHSFSFEKNEIHVHTVNVYFICDIPGNSGLFLVASGRRHRWLTSILLLGITDTVKMLLLWPGSLLGYAWLGSSIWSMWHKVVPCGLHFSGGSCSVMVARYGTIQHYWSTKLGRAGTDLPGVPTGIGHLSVPGAWSRVQTLLLQVCCIDAHPA